MLPVSYHPTENIVKLPTPRDHRFYGMPVVHMMGGNGTWVEAEELAYPKGGLTRRAYVECQDGKRRVVRCGIPDTYTTIPAVAVISGKRTKGYVSHNRQDGSADGFTFTAYTNQNA
jgi:hypothetical protein